MNPQDSSINGYLVAATLGVIGGSVVVAIATRAIPKRMAQMMRNTMTQRRSADFNPMEF